MTDSPGTGYWLNSTKETLRRPPRIQRSQQDFLSPRRARQVFTRRARNHKVYVQEEELFLFPQNHVLALNNKFDILSNCKDLNYFDLDCNNDFTDDDKNMLIEGKPDYDFEYDF